MTKPRLNYYRQEAPHSYHSQRQNISLPKVSDYGVFYFHIYPVYMHNLSKKIGFDSDDTGMNIGGRQDSLEKIMLGKAEDSRKRRKPNMTTFFFCW